MVRDLVSPNGATQGFLRWSRIVVLPLPGLVTDDLDDPGAGGGDPASAIVGGVRVRVSF